MDFEGTSLREELLDLRHLSAPLGPDEGVHVILRLMRPAPWDVTLMTAL